MNSVVVVSVTSCYKNEKSEDYSKADLKQRVLFFITIFRLAIPAFFKLLFSRVVWLALLLNPQPGGPGAAFSLSSPLLSARLGGTYQELQPLQVKLIASLRHASSPTTAR